MSILDIAVAVAVGTLLILAAVAVLHILALLLGKTGHPAVHLVIEALVPYIYRAILAGERMALLGLTQLDTELAGEDKAAVANSIYNLLPDFLLIGKVPVPINMVKMLVPKDKFEALVKDAYEAAHGFLLKNENYLTAQIFELEPIPKSEAAASA